MAKRQKLSKKRSQSMFKSTSANIQQFNLTPKPQRGGYRI